MKTRIISGVIGLFLLLIILFLGGIILDVSVFIVSLIALFEFISVIKLLNLKPLYANNLIFLILLLTISIFNKYDLIILALFIYIISNIVILVFKKGLTLNDVSINIFGGLYTIFLPFHVAFLDGNILIWLIFITAFATDTFAYFTGKAIGKNKLCPNLSPKKTVEGSIGGIVGSLIITYIFIKFNNIDKAISLMLLSLFCSIMAQIGDLSASRIKRLVNIKDFGKIMPGHGGVLDRFDSILFTAPIVYYFMKYLF